MPELVTSMILSEKNLRRHNFQNILSIYVNIIRISYNQELLQSGQEILNSREEIVIQGQATLNPRASTSGAYCLFWPKNCFQVFIAVLAMCKYE